MKIAVVTSLVPFVYGADEILADTLQKKLIEAGHQTIVIQIPFRWRPPEKIIEHMLSNRLIKLDNIDRVIALKFPAYYIPHPRKVLWILSRFRPEVPDTPAGRQIQESVVKADSRFLKEARKIFTVNQDISDCFKKYNNIDSEVLYPPLAARVQKNSWKKVLDKLL